MRLTTISRTGAGEFSFCSEATIISSQLRIHYADIECYYLLRPSFCGHSLGVPLYIRPATAMRATPAATMLETANSGAPPSTTEVVGMLEVYSVG